MSQSFDRVLVTGGLGFIGSHTVDALLDNDVSTWVLDDLSTGSKRNLSRHKQNRNLHVINGSVSNYRAIDRLSRRVEATIHLAGIVSPFVSVQHPEVSNHVNVTGTLNVLRAARKHSLKRIVFASSSSVYGDSNVRRVDENSPTNPITPYGVSKLAGEKYCRAFCSTYGMSTVSLRYFNVYGERQRYNPYSGVIAILVNNLLKTRPVTIFGDGRQTRDFVHVSDVARANLIALSHRQAKGEAFNVGTGVGISINKLCAVLARITGTSRLRPIRKPPRTGDIRHSCASVRRASDKLGFDSRITVEDGLATLVQSLSQA
jgi:UDP-glucose 4-epimerase